MFKKKCVYPDCQTKRIKNSKYCSTHSKAFPNEQLSNIKKRDLEGYILKFGGQLAKRFQKRYVVISSSRMYWFHTNEPSQISRFVINLDEALVATGSAVSEDLRDKHGRALFELVSPEFVKKFVFKAPSEDEYAKWVVALFKYKNEKGRSIARKKSAVVEDRRRSQASRSEEAAEDPAAPKRSFLGDAEAAAAEEVKAVKVSRSESMLETLLGRLQPHIEVIIHVQARWRAIKARRRVRKIKRAIIQFQSLWRGHVARKMYKAELARLVRLQAIQRGRLGRSLVASLHKKRRRLRMILAELLSTEKNYEEALRIVSIKFLGAFEKESQKRRGAAVTPDAIRIIFSNIKAIQLLHSNFLGDFKKILDPPSTSSPLYSVPPEVKLVTRQESEAKEEPEGPEDSHHSTLPDHKRVLSSFEDVSIDKEPLVVAVACRKIGLMMEKMAAKLHIYEDYVNNFEAARAQLSMLANKKEFNTLLEDVYEENEAACQKRDLNSFLIMPVQRIPRYIMLLEDLINHVDVLYIKNSWRAALVRGLHGCREAASDVNESKRNEEGREKVKELAHKIKKYRNSIFNDKRTYVMEGEADEVELDKKAKGKVLPRYLFLFSDKLMISTRKAKKTTKITKIFKTEFRYHFVTEIRLLNVIEVITVPETEELSNMIRVTATTKDLEGAQVVGALLGNRKSGSGTGSGRFQPRSPRSTAGSDKKQFQFSFSTAQLQGKWKRALSATLTKRRSSQLVKMTGSTSSRRQMTAFVSNSTPSIDENEADDSKSPERSR